MNDGMPADSWWQMHTDAVFGADAGFLSPDSKTKLMRDVYVRWIEYSRMVQAAQNGNLKAREKVSAYLAKARKRAEVEGREFSLPADVELWGDQSRLPQVMP
ncbi:hypothetical protein ACLQ3D_20995 [Micromonospora vinacea]|uniref:hypothetical protein n=1 Tax=Micromonospora vinacea TaxID=709878 RepID=UPI003CF8E4A8